MDGDLRKDDGHPAPPQTRDYPALISALNEALSVFAGTADLQEALRQSFDAAIRGCKAQAGLLLLVEQDEPPKFRSIHAAGRISEQQVLAAESGRSAPGISAQVIRNALESRRCQVIQDPRMQTLQTAAFVDEPFSVLCAPIVDPYASGVLAILYFQQSQPGLAYELEDLVWLDTYAAALGRLFGCFFQAQRRECDLKALLGSEARAEGAPDLIGDSHHMLRLRRELHETLIPAASARSPAPFLLLGEKGTGKEVVARYIGAYSERRSGPFVTINCAEITSELAASRFFGHKRGAFTGAISDEKGLFRSAHKGVLFLDEISHLPLPVQATLLRALDYRTVQPVGVAEQIPVDVLLIMATNRDLDDAATKGQFLPDLLDRMTVGHIIRLSALRERPLDIIPLLEHYRVLNERRLRRPTLGFDPAVLRVLAGYPWPGNVRELSGVAAKLVTHTKPGARIDRESLRRAYPQACSPT
ncbi:MAG TPA: sigma 54-interacting transcriptional regulator, partial [Vicinamibacteria bacterium]|nr:sigma 54-interacting transcriptional regulator [Vicinamibacteria bacterium]